MLEELVHRVANGHAVGQDVRMGPSGPILELVKIFVLNNNPQITKARIYLISKFRITYFFELCMLVGISEAIRLLLTYCTNLIRFIKLKLLIYLYEYNIFISGVKYSGFSNQESSYSGNNKDFNKLSPNYFNE
jgi:hypothetical protein